MYIWLIYSEYTFIIGVGVYISRVEEGSVAERAGLRPGDSILQVNGTPFSGISHEDALKVRNYKEALGLDVYRLKQIKKNFKKVHICQINEII